MRAPLVQRDISILVFFDVVAGLCEAALRLIIVSVVELPDAGIEGALVGAEPAQQLAEVLVLRLVGGDLDALGHRGQRPDLRTGRFSGGPPGGADRGDRGFEGGRRSGGLRGGRPLYPRGPRRADGGGPWPYGGQKFLPPLLRFR